MMKTTQKFMAAGVMAMAMIVAVGANADDGRHRHGQPVKVVEKVVYRPVPQAEMFDYLDINNDGLVSRWEFSKRYGNGRMVTRAFNRMDTNESGNLGQREVARGRGLLNELRMRG